MLGVASASLRGLVRAHPLLGDEVFEQIEQEIDAAQQVLRDGLRSDNALTRMRAAAYILRYTEAGRRRMWDSAVRRITSPVEPQTVLLKWIDT
jgi:hypothetical protein